MHCLEHVLFVTSVAVDKDEISKAELVRVLKTLASLSHDYVPATGSESPAIEQMSEEWNRRFGHLLAAKSTDPAWEGWVPPPLPGRFA